ncbi:YeeE/YedE family protein [Rubrivirga sp. S365]|uniref:YeeE/YedE family protein n=1 Tax=Rubrivirga litoralis TaxID=3075598 RepID=A0ABU3BTH4_9BACT|nr:MULTISPECIES: YeeE/YedE family protein [unclassified Rubrivirga]MDT0632596.1 YeeE/YedE family protein [Rubrivirga sp. F394]MDT7856714.1 YeeE/YedE family protein [Rubrivirga sp. S365]
MRTDIPTPLDRGDGAPRRAASLPPTLGSSDPGECLDAEQVPAALRPRALAEGNAPLMLALYGALGAALGLVFTQAQVISWFRIYEMFRFESFHMYGVIGSAVATAALGLWAIRRFGVTTIHGEPIAVQPKAWGGSRVPGARYWMGGLTFGAGWALLGACPGPLFALLGGGVTVMAAALAAALAGTWAYALLRDRLPH